MWRFKMTNKNAKKGRRYKKKTTTPNYGRGQFLHYNIRAISSRLRAKHWRRGCNGLQRILYARRTAIVYVYNIIILHYCWSVKTRFANGAYTSAIKWLLETNSARDRGSRYVICLCVCVCVCACVYFLCKKNRNGRDREVSRARTYQLRSRFFFKTIFLRWPLFNLIIEH
jgi:hypothetical protein